MSNAEMMMKTRMDEVGYNDYDHIGETRMDYALRLKVRGCVVLYVPERKEVKPYVAC